MPAGRDVKVLEEELSAFRIYSVRITIDGLRPDLWAD
jgi:hypothetical protein